MNSSALDPLHTLNTLPAATVAELVDTRSRRYVARLPERGPIPLSARFCFGDMAGRMDTGVDERWASPRFRMTAALLDGWRWLRTWRVRRRARAQANGVRGGNVLRGVGYALLIELLAGAVIVAGVLLHRWHA